jgi:hypothetical protein
MIMRSIDSGPTDGVTPVVKNSFAAPGGRNFRDTCVNNPPAMNPLARTIA